MFKIFSTESLKRIAAFSALGVGCYSMYKMYNFFYGYYMIYWVIKEHGKWEKARQREYQRTKRNGLLGLISPVGLAHCDAGMVDSQRVYLGLSVRSMMDQPGMMVLLVNTDSPAWHGEMKVGDILMEIDGKPINVINDLY